MQELNKTPMVDVLSKQQGRQVVVSGNKYVYLDNKDEVEVSIVSDAIIKNDNDFLKLSRDAKMEEINTSCGNEIVDGFVSNALGAERHYQSEEKDQLNLVGAVTAGIDDYFKTGVADAEGVITWTYEMHTTAELMQVLQNGKAHKLILLQKANNLKVQIENATTLDELDAIGW